MLFKPFVTLGAVAASLLLAGTPDLARGAGASAGGDPVTFSITLDVGEAGIVAACESGCAWKELSAGFEAGVYHISPGGISAYPLEGEEAADARFWITVSAGEAGLSAVCERGCGWKEVSGGRVSTRITEQGIEPTYPAR